MTALKNTFISLEKFFTETGLSGFDFTFDGKAHGIEHNAFKGWYVARKLKDKSYIRVHRWRDDEDFFFSTDEDAAESFRQNTKLTKLLLEEKEREQREIAKTSEKEFTELKTLDESTDYEAKKIYSKIGRYQSQS
jgi:hypothetical protein